VRKQLALRAEPGKRLWVAGNSFGQEFECYETMKARVLSFIDHTHAAAAEFLDDAVVRNGLADHWAEILGPESRQVNEGESVDLLSCAMVGVTPR